jgi:hypothetical protein
MSKYEPRSFSRYARALGMLAVAGFLQSSCGGESEPEPCAKAGESCAVHDCCEGLSYWDEYSECNAVRGKPDGCVCVERVEEPLDCNQKYFAEGQPCLADCQWLNAGLDDMSVTTCPCRDGIFARCETPRSESYLGAATAPSCDTIDAGGEIFLNHQPCPVEWQQCYDDTYPVDAYSAERNNGFCNGHGCACLKRPDGTLNWACGFINGWFGPE